MNILQPHSFVQWLVSAMVGATLLGISQPGFAGGVKIVLPPEFSVSVHDSTDVDVYRGWPLIVEALILPPETDSAKSKGLLVAAASGPWSNAIQFDIQDDQAQVQSWPLHLVNAPLTSVSIGGKVKLPKGTPKDKAAKSMGHLVWYLTPAETSALAPGTYLLSSILSSTNSANSKAWVGQVEALPITIRISDEPAPLSSGLRSQKYQLLARLAHVQGDDTAALAQIDQLLATQTNDVMGLAVKASLLEATGQTNEALRAYSQALEANLAQNPNAAEPPVELLLRQRELLNKLLNLK